MSKNTPYLLGILFTIIIGTLLYCYFCDDCHCFPSGDTIEKNTNEEPPKAPVANPTTRNAFAVSDGNGSFDVKVNDNFNFKTSSFVILKPISEQVTSGVSKLKDYLLANPLKDIDITGYYKSNETNNSAYPNLGLARANAVKNYMILEGIPSKQIDTRGQLNDAITPDDSNTFFGPLQLDIITLEPDAVDEALASTCEAIRKTPLVLHFKTGQAHINLTKAQRQKIADISLCVDKLGVKVLIVGHTDNTGNAANNVVLGQQRAEFAKAYLVKNGILENTIETDSKGSKEPIADNATESGRAQNRRTVVTIK